GLGAAAGCGLPQALRRREPAAVRAAGGRRRPRGRGGAHARAHGPARTRPRRARHALRRQPAAGQHRDRVARRPARAAARRAELLPGPPPARTRLGAHLRTGAGARHHRAVLDARRGGGRALRRPGARPGRRRAAVRGLARRAGGGRRLAGARLRGRVRPLPARAGSL
ncbi:MAG: ABC transporter ATP-binding protein, partial [uncultured Solirubrobacteraceae bacterium]